jgi:hypothetical protein
MLTPSFRPGEDQMNADEWTKLRFDPFDLIKHLSKKHEKIHLDETPGIWQAGIAKGKYVCEH